MRRLFFKYLRRHARILSGLLLVLAGVVVLSPVSPLSPVRPLAAQAAVAGAAPADGYAVANDGALDTVNLAGTWSFTPVSPAAPSISIPADAAGNTVILAFGAVNFQATLTIGSTVVGTTTTSFLPTSFNLT